MRYFSLWRKKIMPISFGVLVKSHLKNSETSLFCLTSLKENYKKISQIEKKFWTSWIFFENGCQIFYLFFCLKIVRHWRIFLAPEDSWRKFMEITRKKIDRKIHLKIDAISLDLYGLRIQYWGESHSFWVSFF